MAIEVGTIVTGKITGITNFGAFVSLPDGTSGMVHISEVSHTYVEDIRQHLQEGQEVQVKVLEPDRNGRTNLSIKKTAAPPPREPRQSGFVNRARPAGGPQTFEDKLKSFMQDSSETRAAAEPARGGDRRRKGKARSDEDDYYDDY